MVFYHKHSLTIIILPVEITTLIVFLKKKLILNTACIHRGLIRQNALQNSKHVPLYFDLAKYTTKPTCQNICVLGDHGLQALSGSVDISDYRPLTLGKFKYMFI